MRPAHGRLVEDEGKSRSGICNRRLHPERKEFRCLILGYYESGKLIYVGRTRNGFTLSLREKLFRSLKGLHSNTCPFVNLPEASQSYGIHAVSQRARLFGR